MNKKKLKPKFCNFIIDFRRFQSSVVARGGGKEGTSPKRGRKTKKCLKNARKCIKFQKIFRLRRLPAPQAPLIFNYKGQIFYIFKKENTKFVIFRSCGAKFLSPKFFSIGSPPPEDFSGYAPVSELSLGWNSPKIVACPY